MSEPLDFVVSFERRGAVYWVRVISSPAGDGGDPFVPPFSIDEIPAIRSTLVRSVRHLEAAEAEDKARPALRDIGEALFNTLFMGRCVRSLYDRSRERARVEERVLRIRLRFDLSDRDVAWLANLPWEYLCEQGDYLGLPDVLTSTITIGRVLEAQRAPDTVPLTPPLRILVAVASPRGAPRLDFEAECKKIEAALEPGSPFEITFERGIFELCRNRLEETNFHVFHFIGHGEYDDLTGRGSLLFETSSGGQDLVDSDLFANLFRGVTPPRLIVLNACETARSAPAGELDAFAGLASALVRRGIYAVVAMQFPISDKSAIAFAGGFYKALGDGAPIDLAVANGRLKISYQERSRAPEWGSPALFMRASDGRLFVPKKPPAEAGEKKEPPGSVITAGRDVLIAERIVVKNYN